MSDDVPTAAEAVEAARNALPHLRLATLRAERASRLAAMLISGCGDLPSEPAQVNDLDIVNALLERLPEAGEFRPEMRYARMFAWAAQMTVDVAAAAYLGGTIWARVGDRELADRLRALPEWRALKDRLTDFDRLVAVVLK